MEDEMHPILFHREFLAHRPYSTATYDHLPPKRQGLLNRWMRATSEGWQRRKTIAALHALDDHTLRDIGIHRSNIERFADGLCGRDNRIDALQAAPVERHRGQSRLLFTS